MVTNNYTKSDLYQLNNIVQLSAVSYPKEAVISALREFFKDDVYYRYVSDAYGFPLTPSHKDFPIEAGMTDKTTTRLFIGESYRFDIVYYPAILVKHAGVRSVPISMNREMYNVEWGLRYYDDGYGAITAFKYPKNFIAAGAFEGSIAVDIMTRSLKARDEISELVSILFIDLAFHSLEKAGLIIKEVSIGSPSETQDRNDTLFKVSITLNYRSEWRREIPIGNILETINIAMDIGNIENPNYIYSPNIKIEAQQTLEDTINDIIAGIAIN